MSLGKHEVVPVDTHVYQITAAYYMPQLKQKSLSQKLYKDIGLFTCSAYSSNRNYTTYYTDSFFHYSYFSGDFYVEKFGSYAGWAQGVLFSANLSYFSTTKDTKSKAKRTKTDSVAIVSKKKKSEKL